MSCVISGVSAGEFVEVTPVGSHPGEFCGSDRAMVFEDPDGTRLLYDAGRKVGGVTITTVPAAHSNGIDPAFIGDKLGAMLQAAGITAYAGPPTGYVLQFSNGLVVYLSGDTGVTAEQQIVVREQYGAKLAVMNIGDTYTTGPKEAAHVVNELVRPNAVIASHTNEVATEGGRLLPDTRTAEFSQHTRVPVYLPLSGRSMRFDRDARCVAGCS